MFLDPKPFDQRRLDSNMETMITKHRNFEKDDDHISPRVEQI